jgi:hypothetical protein
MKEAISVLSASVCVMFCLNSGGVVQSVGQKVSAVVRPAKVASGGNVKALMKAIVLQESSGDYTLVNRDSGAIGLAQLMPENVGPWCKEAGEGNVTPSQFRYDKALQLRVIEFKIGQYYAIALRKANGDRATAAKMVASAWYSGQMGKYNDTRPQPYGGTVYPSIAYYSNKAYLSAVNNGYR